MNSLLNRLEYAKQLRDLFFIKVEKIRRTSAINEVSKRMTFESELSKVRIDMEELLKETKKGCKKKVYMNFGVPVCCGEFSLGEVCYCLDCIGVIKICNEILDANSGEKE